MLLHEIVAAYSSGRLDLAAAQAIRFGEVVKAASALMEVYQATTDDAFPIDNGLIIPPAGIVVNSA